MRCKALLVTVVAGALCSTIAMAGPTTPGASSTAPKAKALMGPHVGLDGTFSENFDAYANGSGIAGQGGWQFWNQAAGSQNGTVDNALASSAPNSLLSTAETDQVQTFNLTTGKYRLRAMTYTPSTMTGEGFMIVLNTHDGPPVTTGFWSLQIRFNPATGLVLSDFGGQTTPLITNQWVELRADIDLDATTCGSHGGAPQPGGCLDVYYGGTQFVFDENWALNVSGAGVAEFRLIDLYATGAGFRWDNVLVEDMNCYPDCNGSGTLTIADFGCFQAAFAAGNMYADCNNSGTLTIADFGCFQAAFAAGCP